MRTAPGCENVTMAYLDWCDDKTKASGLPDTFTSPMFTPANGPPFKNPLYSFVFNKGVFDDRNPPNDTDYTKPKGYETVRYPLSGLVGLPNTDQRAKTEAYNATFTPEQCKQQLNDNVKHWLQFSTPIGPTTHDLGTVDKFRKCLDAPSYTIFSNTSSATQYNQDMLNTESTSFSSKTALVVPLESPHNDIHLAVGGFTPPPDNKPDVAVPKGANGDMVGLR